MTAPASIHAAVYARVSTTSQELDGQQRDLESYIRSKGWQIAESYSERVSATGKVERKEYDRLLRDARDPDRVWSHLVVWALDRFSRAERFTQAVDAIFDLEKHGVSFHSVRESYLDSPPAGQRNMGRELLLAIIPTIATFESIRRSERVRIAMREIAEGRRATKSGKRPRLAGHTRSDRQDSPPQVPKSAQALLRHRASRGFAGWNLPQGLLPDSTRPGPAPNPLRSQRSEYRGKPSRSYGKPLERQRRGLRMNRSREMPSVPKRRGTGRERPPRSPARNGPVSNDGLGPTSSSRI